MTSKRVSIGVFIPAPVQFLDVACVDTLGVMSKKFLADLKIVPSHVIALAPEVSLFYITAPKQGTDVPLSSSAVIKASHHYTDEEVAPGRLDIVVVPGPIEVDEFDEEGLKWLRGHFESTGGDVLSICSGAFVCAAAGIADGKVVSGPRAVQYMLQERFTTVIPANTNFRWVQDGNLWSSGGVTNGNDLVAAYARSSRHWHQSIVEIGLKITEVGDRGQLYDVNTSRYMLGFGWEVVRAWFAGIWNKSG